MGPWGYEVTWVRWIRCSASGGPVVPASPRADYTAVISAVVLAILFWEGLVLGPAGGYLES